MIVDFSIRDGANDRELIFKDTTPSYEGQAITDRYINIEVAGSIKKVPFPLVAGVGDEIKYTFTNPAAVKATLVLVSGSPAVGSVYTRTKYTVMLDRYNSMIEKKVKNLVLVIDPKNILTAPQELLRDIEWCYTLVDGARDFVAEGDLVASQEFVDYLEQIYKLS